MSDTCCGTLPKRNPHRTLREIDGLARHCEHIEVANAGSATYYRCNICGQLWAEVPNCESELVTDTDTLKVFSLPTI